MSLWGPRDQDHRVRVLHCQPGNPALPETTTLLLTDLPSLGPTTTLMMRRTGKTKTQTTQTAASGMNTDVSREDGS